MKILNNKKENKPTWVKVDQSAAEIIAEKFNRREILNLKLYKDDKFWKIITLEPDIFLEILTRFANESQTLDLTIRYLEQTLTIIDGVDLARTIGNMSYTHLFIPSWIIKHTDKLVREVMESAAYVK